MADKDSTAPKRKRPLGLKARSAKKANTQVTEQGAQQVNDFDDENTATVMLRGEDADEIDELEGIFDSALEALSEDQAEKAITLLRGTIHESDRLLRLNDTEKESKMEPRFYFIYGSALYGLAELSPEIDDRDMYLELAQHRLEQAEEIIGEEPFAWRVYLGLAKVHMEIAAEADSESSACSGIQRALEYLKKAIDALKATQAEEAVNEETLAAIDLALSLADSQRLPEQAAAKLIGWGESNARLLAENASSDAKYLLARALWLRASSLIDESDEISDREEFTKLLSEATELLDGIESCDGLLLLGEIEINLGNVQEDELDMESKYKQAVATFRRAQEKGEVPEQFIQFIDDFENE
ncbi:hypothetical protein IWW36_000386 [Coemansia brasiliensis]|uniref:Uncharacterized protein n=1 Tax=Coemansia brasiliensis TaxID=2650707 RepID=A0A9W8IB34_9FUNG|nr:hypothetical protein IWW36_000386 [Coemansia brasiliensis]